MNPADRVRLTVTAVLCLSLVALAVAGAVWGHYQQKEQG